METALTTVNGTSLSSIMRYSPEQIDLIRNTVAKECNDQELALFLYQCQRTGLDALARQIYAIKRGGKLTIQTSIDGYRLTAERSKKYEGQTPVMWCGPDGQWVDVWLQTGNPAAAKVGVYRAGFHDAVWAVAKWNEYYQAQNPSWGKMGALMLGKCAEALALRKTFPQELSGLYTAEEMQQADSVTPPDQQAPPQIVDTNDEVKKAWKGWRAKANKRWAECKILADLETSKAEFEKIHKGPQIWAQYTFHNDYETFASLFDEHAGRVKTDEDLNSPEGIQRWIAALDKCGTPKELSRFVSDYRTQTRLMTVECEDALQERARYLGMMSYTDVEAPEGESFDSHQTSEKKE